MILVHVEVERNTNNVVASKLLIRADKTEAMLDFLEKKQAENELYILYAPDSLNYISLNMCENLNSKNILKLL